MSENSCTCRVCIREREVQVSSKSSKAWLRQERNKYTNKLIHKPQAHSRGPNGVRRKYIRRIRKKNGCQLKHFAFKQSSLEGCRRAVTRPFRMKLTTKVVHNIKGISNITVNYHCVYYSSFGCSYGNYRKKSRVCWFFRTVWPIYSIVGMMILLTWNFLGL